MTLRKVIGILGIALAFIVVAGGSLSGVFMSSISAYYHTNMQDIFVGFLMVVGAFLLSYKGYDKLDDTTATIAGLAAIGVGLFPCTGLTTGFLLLSSSLSNLIHLVSATIFFTTIAFISSFQFTKTGAIVTVAKKKRNRLYKVSGLIIAACIVVLLFLNIFATAGYFVLIAEAIMLVAFGISWLVKGEAILKDI